MKDSETEEKSDGTIMLDDLAPGMEVNLLDKDGEVLASGEVSKVLAKSIKIEDSDNGEVSTVKKEKIDSVTELEEATSLDVDDLEEGMEVSLADKKGETLASGEVEKVSKKAITIDGEKIKVKKIDAIFLLESEDENPAIDWADLEEGMNVTMLDEDDEELATGNVEKLLKTVVTVAGTKVKKSEAKTIRVEEVEETEIDLKNVEEKMFVRILGEDGEELASGEVEKVSKKAIVIDDVKVKVKNIGTIMVAALEPDKEEKPDKKDKDKSGEKVPGVTKIITDMICANPKLTEEKIAKKLSKTGLNANEATLHITYRKLQTVFESLREAGNME